MNKKISRFLIAITLVLPLVVNAQFENNPLSQAVDNTSLNFINNTPGFFVQSTVVNFGSTALQSANINNDQEAVVFTQFIDTDGLGATISFDWRVSSEEDFDFLVFLILDENGELFESRGISGEKNWSTISTDIPNGNYFLSWAYVKDGSISQGADAGYIDRVRITRNSSSLVPGCLNNKTILNSALDNDDLNFTNSSGSTISVNQDWNCRTDGSSVGGTAAFSNTNIVDDLSEMYADVTGPIDLLFDWQVLGGDEYTSFRVDIFDENSEVIFEDKITGPAVLEDDKPRQTVRLRIPDQKIRVRWAFFGAPFTDAQGVLDNFRLEESTGSSVSVLPSIILLLDDTD